MISAEKGKIKFIFGASVHSGIQTQTITKKDVIED
jgi:hypothetical protein